MPNNSCLRMNQNKFKILLNQFKTESESDDDAKYNFISILLIHIVK